MPMFVCVCKKKNLKSLFYSDFATLYIFHQYTIILLGHSLTCENVCQEDRDAPQKSPTFFFLTCENVCQEDRDAPQKSPT
jgi:hypothetical protein